MFPRQLEESDSKLTGIFIKGQHAASPTRQYRVGHRSTAPFLAQDFYMPIKTTCFVKKNKLFCSTK